MKTIIVLVVIFIVVIACVALFIHVQMSKPDMKDAKYIRLSKKARRTMDPDHDDRK